MIPMSNSDARKRLNERANRDTATTNCQCEGEPTMSFGTCRRCFKDGPDFALHHPPKIDLDALEALAAEGAALDRGPCLPMVQRLSAAVPALVAEIRRLRKDLRALIQSDTGGEE